MAATGHLELYAFEIAVVDHQHVFLLRHDGRCGVGQVEGFGTSHLGAFGHTGFALLQFHIRVERGVEIDLVFRDVGVEIARFLVTQFFYELIQGAFVPLKLAILQFALEHLASHHAVATLHLAQGLANFRTGMRRHHDVQPFEAGLLRIGGEDLNTLSAAQGLAQRHIFAVDDASHATIPDFRMDEIGEIQDRTADRQLKQVAFRCEHVDRIFFQPGAHAVVNVGIFAGFEGCANVGQPAVDAALTALHPFVAPVCCQPMLGHFVHALGANLHFDPLVFGSQDCDVQTFVAVRLRHGDPIA